MDKQTLSCGGFEVFIRKVMHVPVPTHIEDEALERVMGEYAEDELSKSGFTAEAHYLRDIALDTKGNYTSDQALHAFLVGVNNAGETCGVDEYYFFREKEEETNV